MPKKTKLVRITRSFSYKKNLGNYQTADFFCSQSAEVPEKDAEKTSEALYQFCKQEVVKSVNKYQEDKPLDKGEIMMEIMAYLDKGEMPSESLVDQYNNLFPLLIDKKISMKDLNKFVEQNKKEVKENEELSYEEIKE